MGTKPTFFQKWSGRVQRWSGGWRGELRRTNADLSAALAREAELTARHQATAVAAEQTAGQLTTARSEVEALASQVAGLLCDSADLGHQLQTAQATADELNRQLAATRPPPRNDLPSILSVTLPKSGTVFLLTLFHKGLGHLPTPVSLTYFPKDLIDWQKLEDMRKGGWVVPSHLDASPANVQYLTVYRQPVHLHLRDPRQATLSMTHHMARYQREFGPTHGAPLQVCPTTPVGFCDWPLAEQNEWMIAHYLPSCVTWIRDWLAQVDAPGGPPFPILLTTFEEMIRDETAVVRRILDFFAVPNERYTPQTVEKSMGSHFRQGTPDEWKSVFTPDQQDAATRLIPLEWVERFGWDHRG